MPIRVRFVFPISTMIEERIAMLDQKVDAILQRLDHSLSGSLPKLLNSAEVCSYLEISNTTLWRYVKQNRIQPVRIGDRNLFTTEEVLRFLSGSKHE